MELRSYQKEAVQKASEYLSDSKRKKPELIVLPTAAGKSIVIAEIARLVKGKVLVLQPSQELLSQNLSKYLYYGNKASVYCAGLKRKELDEQVIFATLDSVKVETSLQVDVLLIDEAHYKFSPDPGSSFMSYVEVIKPKKVIGLTATPFRLDSTMDGSMLKLLTRRRPNYFKDFIHITQIQEIIQNGFWSKIDYEVHEFDTSLLRLNTSGSEFTEESVKKALEAQSVNRRMYYRIKKELEDGCQSILVFCDRVGVAKEMSIRIPGSSFLTAETNKKDREQTITAFKNGSLKVLFNVGILTTGFDFPDLRCVIMGRPTNSLALYYQIIGRGTRISPQTGKVSFKFIDFGGNVERFGPIEHLTLEYVEGFGWAFCNGEIVLTNVLMGAARVSKSSFVKKSSPGDTKLWFGKHKGKEPHELPLSYIHWVLYESPFTWTHPKFAQLKANLIAVLEEDKRLANLKN